ncbi:MAG: cupin domain-containing protein [Planctomycetes bacterium]|nr:cupin domain-containing protein [Planctomycetota bacterium]
MKVNHFADIEEKPVEMEGARGCMVRWLVSESDGAPNFAMRRFEVAPGGFTPRHSHPYEHEVYVLEGEGVVYENDQPHPLRPGAVVLVKPDEVHQFQNTGDAPLKFLCLVPNDAAKKTVTVAPECGVQ